VTLKRAESMDEIVIDGVSYVVCYKPSGCIFGDASHIFDRFNEKEREEINRRMIGHLVEAGYFKRKEDYEKEHSVYKKGELFYGIVG
jgi:hypothetical protein